MFTCVLVRLHISLLMTRLSSSCQKIPAPDIICSFYLTRGLKAFGAVITVIV